MVCEIMKLQIYISEKKYMPLQHPVEILPQVEKFKYLGVRPLLWKHGVECIHSGGAQSAPPHQKEPIEVVQASD